MAIVWYNPEEMLWLYHTYHVDYLFKEEFDVVRA